MEIRLMAIMVAVMLAGCGGAADQETADREKAGPSSKPFTDQVVEGFTGRTAVDAGMRAKSKIDGANAATANRQKDMDDALGE